MFLTLLGFTSTANAQITDQLESYCGTGAYDTWTDVDMTEWYMRDDWEDFFEDGMSPYYPNANPGVREVYPAGFRYYVLGHYNEPPVCMLVPGSADTKVEILIESPLENANLCIYDASYNQVSTNNVGNIQNCGSGKVYACFTAATVGSGDFGFLVKCMEGCEDSDVPVWMRIRVSKMTWEDGKSDTTDDLEHWCEGERGSIVDIDAYNIESDWDEPLYYTYPSDLIPDEPSEWPFHIHQIWGKNAGSQTSPSMWAALAAVGVWLLLG